jgi:hypothetical protein
VGGDLLQLIVLKELSRSASHDSSSSSLITKTGINSNHGIHATQREYELTQAGKSGL